MKTIIKHGYALYEEKCSNCGCVFDYELEDIIDNHVICPDCKHECTHSNANYKMTSQLQDNPSSSKTRKNK